MLYGSYNEIATFESHRLPISCSTETKTEETSKFDCPSIFNFLLLAEGIFTGMSSSLSKINHVKRKKETHHISEGSIYCNNTSYSFTNQCKLIKIFNYLSIQYIQIGANFLNKRCSSFMLINMNHP